MNKVVEIKPGQLWSYREEYNMALYIILNHEMYDFQPYWRMTNLQTNYNMRLRTEYIKSIMQLEA